MIRGTRTNHLRTNKMEVPSMRLVDPQEVEVEVALVTGLPEDGDEERSAHLQSLDRTRSVPTSLLSSVFVD